VENQILKYSSFKFDCYELSSKIKINSNFIYTYVDRDAINDNGLGSVNAINTPATISALDANGEYSLVPVHQVLELK
jgi:hypothetical protein